MDFQTSSPKASKNPALWVVLGGVLILAVLGLIWYVAGAQPSANTNVTVNTSVSNNNSGVNTNQSPTNTNQSVANVNSTPEGWTTYDSSQSRLAIFNRLSPAFTVSYPSAWHASEELGGLFLTEAARSEAESSISVERLDKTFGDDVLQDCKDLVANTTGFRVVYDTARMMIVGGVSSAYLSYHLTADQYPNEGSRSDSLYVCVPHETTTDVIFGIPRSSALVHDNFDAILATFSLKQ